MHLPITAKGQPTESATFSNSYLSGIKNTGVYRIRNGLSGKYLEVKGAIDANGTKVQQYQYNGGANQIWKLVKDKEGTYRLYQVRRRNPVYWY